MSTKKRVSRMIERKDEVDYFLSLKEEDITYTFMAENFGQFKGKCKYHPWDLIKIPVGAYSNDDYENDKPFVTTIGTWIFNIYFIREELMHIFGYVTDTLTKGKIGKMNDELSYARLEQDITLDQMRHFLMKTQHFMPFVSILSPNQSEILLKLAQIVEPKKKELFKKYKKEIEAGDIVVSENIEKQLLAFVKETLKDDDVWDIIESGARINFGNHIKNMYVMKGAMRDPITGEFNIAESCYSSGMSKDEYKYFANSLSAGPYSRARNTSTGGADEKYVVSGYQHVRILKRGTDCHTKRTLTVDFSKENIYDYIYSYIVEGDKLIEITSKNISKYNGKTVKIRFSSLCESKQGYCSKCMGNLLYRLHDDKEEGVENVGVTLSIIPSTLKNICMKAFHDSTISTYLIEPDKYFI